MSGFTCTRLDPPIWLETPKGLGLAHLVWDGGLELSLYWTVFLQNGQIWTFENEKVRAVKNVTLDREEVEKPNGPT